jgi:hypothetical protein
MKRCHILTVRLVASLACLMIVACQDDAGPASTGDPDLHITRVTADEIAALDRGSLLPVAAATEDDVLIFDPSRGPLDFGRVELTCPNGQQMDMDTWLLDLEKKRSIDLQQLTSDSFALARTPQTAVKGLEALGAPAAPRVSPYDAECPPPKCWKQICVQSCYWCPDGAYICTCTWQTVCQLCAEE